ncbi:uncharacterized protein B0I36DRAFT_338561 [Microdochium trichocladiopsis]|uniref:Hypersensitive response-inducing protein n=1 Tax=Microdochium trichocladiopsis TaxID=1682393 RepID=A0A9P9BLQ4_9PEZI|nr:uncharacterized protein B0I36DRAFT_338561 [Microdochium trichocladiopsis]KAH7014327.1 hypothetical protein B0I36DRAFT_338561 [Microdochium trichocladiopsis]
MKFFAPLTLAAAASAATLERKQEKTKNIGEFSAACIPHSVMCSYSFTVSNDPSLPVSNCEAFLAGPDRLPPVDEGKCADNSAYTWTTDRTTDGGLDFTVSFPLNSRSNITYCATLPASDFVVDDNGSVQTERYTGPTGFAATVDACFQ